MSPSFSITLLIAALRMLFMLIKMLREEKCLVDGQYIYMSNICVISFGG